jgi:O-antigen/teichoic acid export membrane protein
MLGKIKFFKEISSSVFAMGCKTIVGFISIPLFITHLGTDRYGLWMVAISTLTFINLLDAGVFPTIKNRLTEYNTVNDSGKYNLYLYSGFVFGGFLFILGLVLGFFFVIIDINSFFKITDPIAKIESLPLFMVLYVIMVVSISLSNVENYYASKILLSRIRFFEGILTIVMFCITYLVLIYTNNLVLVAFLFASPIFIIRIILFLNLISNKNIIIFPLREVITIIKLEIKPSISFLGIKFSEIIITMIPNFYIARQFNLSEVTHYNIVFKFISIPLILISAILPSIWPMLTLAWHKGNKVWIKKIIRLSLIVTSIVFLIYLTLAAIFGVDIIYVLSSKAVKSNIILILLLGLLSFVMGIVYWVSTFLHSISDFKFEFLLHIILATSISVLGGFAIKFYGLNSFIFTMIISWFFIAFVPMYKRAINFLNDQK